MKKLILGGGIAFVMFLSAFCPTVLAQSEDGFGSSIYVGNINVPGTEETEPSSSLLDYASNAINWVLGFLATIALVLCLYAGFLITTARGDDAKVKKGTAIIKNAAIGIVIILLSWGIVRLIFWAVDLVQK